MRASPSAPNAEPGATRPVYLAEGPMTPTRLAGVTGISKQGINYLLQSLEASGFIVRRASQIDRITAGRPTTVV